MNAPASQRDEKGGMAEKSFGVAAPSLSLPKGGGAIKGIGEKFAANPVTGTGSMTIPLSISPGRSGFGPQLALAYDSGTGNGAFGLGWNLSLPAITRKTDKGLPQYRDTEESDVFILSGAEDLVPLLVKDGSNWVREQLPACNVNRASFRIDRYRPRIEGLFARIERWSNVANPADIRWRSISKDNLTTWYGSDAGSRIADPSDPSHIFSWLICQTHDDKGNVMVYEYADEDSQGIDLAQPQERNRTDAARGTHRYLRRIRYGNRTPYFPDYDPAKTSTPLPSDEDWMFSVVFDYDEGRYQTVSAAGTDPQLVHATFDPATPLSGWPIRQDPFSSYRSCFEVRTYRLCRRVLMFHHFTAELKTPACLVRSTEFNYQEEPVGSFVTSVIQSGYLRLADGDPRQTGDVYRKKSLPPVEFEYSTAKISSEIRDVDPSSLENLPVGLDGSAYQWVDLDGEGLTGILAEQGGSWYYKRNLSALPQPTVTGLWETRACFAPVECVARLPASATAAGRRHQFLDLAGDGSIDVVEFDGQTPGFYERTSEGSWGPFTAFRSLPNLAWDDPNQRFIDLTGDGHADILITEDNVFTYHFSLAEDGFDQAEKVYQSFDDEIGPRLLVADATVSISVADMSGDGLADLVRIRNGEVCYWPNLGYGRFGAKVTLDNSPWFDLPDQFDPKRLRLADIDGSGTTDLIYLGRNRIAIYRNLAGNRFADAEPLDHFPPVDNHTAVQACDLLGNGTACLVWSSPLSGDATRPMRYIDLMGGQKPHLLIKCVNNLGAETTVQYAPSTKFYLADKLAGRPWITKLPFPVHVVDRVETHDLISRSRFVSCYAYHHGYFDGEEREFRGFGMVEQWDTGQFAALKDSDNLPDATNIDKSSYVPPACTKTWFHTGAWIEKGLISGQFEHEYYREGDRSESLAGLADDQLEAMLLPDTILPTTLKRKDGTAVNWALTADEVREACRALKGSVLRREVYAFDGTDAEDRPYSVTEQNYTIELLQPRGGQPHAVFFTHARESIEYRYERKLYPVLNSSLVVDPSLISDPLVKWLADPRVSHAITLEVDAFGNVLKSAAIGYGRHLSDSTLLAADRAKQTQTLITYTENQVTNAIDADDNYRAPLPAEAQTYEITGLTLLQGHTRFSLDEMLTEVVRAAPLDYEKNPTPGGLQKRLIEHLRTLYRADDLTGLLPLSQLASLGLTGESYKLAFTPGLLAQVFQRPRAGQPLEALLPDPSNVLGGQAGDRGGYVQSQTLKADGRFPGIDADDQWWIPSGRSFFSPNPADAAAAELIVAQQNFFLTRRYRDPFSQDGTVSFDANDLLIVETRDALGNRVTVEAIDYRVLQPRLVSDPNRNQTGVVFDTLGLVAGTVVMGKPSPAPVEGDSPTGFAPDLTQAQIDAFYGAADPHTTAPVLMQSATTRIVYDLDRFRLTQSANPADPTKWLPPLAATLARETHANDPLPPYGLKIQISFSYSDGFGREIQKKIQAEPGPVVGGGPTVTPRWVGSGWTIFNNKGRPVRQYEPFFSATHRHEFGVKVGVSPVLFYDPVDRVIVTLHPNHTYEKVVFDPWQQTTFDVNDTVAARNAQTGDPRTDSDIKGYVKEYFEAQSMDPAHPWQTWHQQRIGGVMGSDELAAAEKAAAHADTPTTAYFDTLGRPFLTVTHNRVVCLNHDLDGSEDTYCTRVELDIEGNQRTVRDAIVQAGDAQGRIIMRYAYDILGNRIHQLSMEAGTHWMLNDIAGKPIRAWDSRGHNFVTAYDALRRPVKHYVRGTTTDSDPRTLNRDILVDQIEYGEGQSNAESLNLRTQIYRHSDSAGVATNAQLDASGTPIKAYDFKGNLLGSTRRLVSDYAAIPDWLLNPNLESETFNDSTRYDALNRPVQSVAPHSSLARAKLNIIQPGYNEANLLEKMDVWLERAAEPAATLNPATDAPSLVGIDNIDYDAKAQRQRIDYKNGASTFYDYDPLTFRLQHLRTKRNATAFPDDDPTPQLADWPGRWLQNLSYTYDPAGNIIRIQDDAQQTDYFRNKRVEPSAEYTYDAIYRLIEATGREHLGQIGGAPIPHSHDDAPRVGIDWSANDGNAMGTYIERYVYDAAGNFLKMQHRGSDPVHPGWTRAYAYGETSLVEDGTGLTLLKTSNRLSNTTVNPNGINPPLEPYRHDVHGNMTRMPHLGAGQPAPNMHWDYQDQLRQTDLGGGGSACYVYDGSGQRVRKVWEKSANLIEERLYFGGFEIFRRHGGAIGANTATLERETLHIMDDKQRIAMVETRSLDTAGTDSAPAQLIRYQFGNHLGSASLELDDQAQIISYEEYTPYGSTSYQAVRSQTETPKRYRYTGMERDEESGLGYHGARYYAPWLGRWSSADPMGLEDGLNLYAYCADNPSNNQDIKGTEHVSTDDRRPASPPSSGVAPIETQFRKEADAVIIKSEPLPRTPKEKKEDVDIETPEHDAAVVTIINSAIDAAVKDAEEKGYKLTNEEILHDALYTYVSNLRSRYGPVSTQNILLRDVDHFFAGRLNEWRKAYLAPVNSFLPEVHLPMRTVPPDKANAFLAAEIYDAVKRSLYGSNPRQHDSDVMIGLEENDFPAAAPGGRVWAFLGAGQTSARKDLRDDNPGSKPNAGGPADTLHISVKDVTKARNDYRNTLDTIKTIIRLRPILP